MQITNIWRGDAGLAVTYWGYGIVGSALLSVPLAFVTPGSTPAIMAVIFFVLYVLLLGVGLWRAAVKYQGPKIWAFLAKVAVVVPLVSVVIGIGAAILIPSAANGNHAQNSRIKTPAVGQDDGCEQIMAVARAKRPEWSHLPEDSLVRVVQQVYYPAKTVEEVAEMLCVKLPPPKQLAKLGPIDAWYYQSCRKEAAHAPTPQGVNIGIQLCRERFDQ